MSNRTPFDGFPSVVVAVVGAVIIGGGAVLGGGLLSVALSPDAALDQTPVAMETPQTTTPAPPAPSTSADGSGGADVEPEAPTPRRDVPEIVLEDDDAVEADEYMVAAAHPAAAQAGAIMIEQGGSAIDAAIAAQMVLNLVEPQSSGIGGGGFMLHWNKPKRRLDSYDGRETAPMEIPDTAFLKPDGDAMAFFDAVAGGRSVGVPGLLRMLEMAHRQHGSLPWATLFQPAIDLAESGFPVSPRLHGLLANARGLADSPTARAYFYQADGSPHPVGAILTNPEFAATLKEVAEKGADAFYTGPIAEDIVAAVQGAFRNPGWMQLEDMSAYRALRRPNLCQDYREHFVCGMAPPSSGGSTVLQALAMLNTVELEDFEPYSPEAIQAVAEASALAFADRNAFLADSDFVKVPLRGLLDPAYVRSRAQSMDLGAGEKQPKDPGQPDGAASRAMDMSLELPSTTHLSIVDRDGNAVSLTSSIETGFGSRLMVRGFLLNNQLTDFSWRAERDGKPVANRIEPGKRPRSSMAPTLVFDEDRDLMMVTGSPGGSRIIGYTLQSIINVIDWDMNPQEAVNAPHYLHRNTGRLELEEGPAALALAGALEARGYALTVSPMTSGLHMIVIDDDDLEGGADPRREGAAIGEEQAADDLMKAFDFIQAGN
ncbi:MAG: gamma-glutamyltransferase [Alphaproteobacteria bacterium]|nr:gamma-glutamyltransferase [Alphaproteobacteria bacterium]